MWLDRTFCTTTTKKKRKTTVSRFLNDATKSSWQLHFVLKQSIFCNEWQNWSDFAMAPVFFITSSTTLAICWSTVRFTLASIDKNIPPRVKIYACFAYSYISCSPQSNPQAIAITSEYSSAIYIYENCISRSVVSFLFKSPSTPPQQNNLLKIHVTAWRSHIYIYICKCKKIAPWSRKKTCSTRLTFLVDCICVSGWQATRFND